MSDWYTPTPRRSSPIVQTDVEGEIMRLSGELEDQNEELVGLAERRAKADAAYHHVHSVALMTVEGKNAELREAQAHLQVEAEYLERNLSAALYDACEKVCRNVRQQLSALQSVAANQRALV